MNIAEAVKKLIPTAEHGRDFIVQDDSDGNGPYIAKWNLPDPQPTEAELAAAWELIKDKPEPLSEIEKVKAEAAKSSADFQAFMDYYFSKNPE